MPDLGPFAARLAEATDVTTAAERLAEHLRAWVVDGGASEAEAAVRVYIHGQGDQCSSCPRRGGSTLSPSPPTYPDNSGMELSFRVESMGCMGAAIVWLIAVTLIMLPLGYAFWWFKDLAP